MAEVRFLRAAVNNIAIRDEVGSTDRIGDFGKDDAMKLVKPLPANAPLPEWVEVTMVGAVRAPAEEGVARQDVGFVRTRNRVAELIVAWPDDAEAEGSAAEAAWTAQAAEREGGTCWFRSATRTSLSAPQHARPLLQGGVEEYENRQKLFEAAATHVRQSKNIDVPQLRAALELQFDNAPWLSAFTADKPLLHILTMVSKVEASETCDDVPLEFAAPKPPTDGETAILPPPSPHPAATAAVKKFLDMEPGAVSGPEFAADLCFGLAHDAFAELWVRLPWAARSNFACLSKAACLSARSVPWRRLCQALAEERGLLVAELALEACAAAPVEDAEWRLFFVDMWRRRRFVWDSARRTAPEQFKINAIVRFRPAHAADAADDAIFLPLHQRLQLRRLGHETGLAGEVAQRLGDGADEDVETYEARQDRRKAEARRNTDALRHRSLGDDAPAPAGAPAPAAGADENAPPEAEAPGPNGDAPEARRKKMSAKVVSTEARRVLVSVPGSGLSYFDFGAVLDSHLSQSETYAAAAAPLVSAMLQGQNACLLAYGQTGSGKTHTMFGPPGTLDESAAQQGLNDLTQGAGVVPRVVADALKVCAAAHLVGVEADLSFSYLELYDDKLTDLLTGGAVRMFRVGEGAAADEHRAKNRALKSEDSPILLQGATVHDCSAGGAASAWRALAAGEARKRRAATAMNARSSRAHTVLALELVQRRNGRAVTSRLYLVDLGGSEQLKRSKAEGDRFWEAVRINKSLSALGRVVDALVAKNAHHVPYYESPLTMLLQPAFGGDSRTTVLVNASPDALDGDETLASLRFGLRCAKVQHAAADDGSADMGDVLEALEAQVRKSEAEVQRLEACGARQIAERELSQKGLRGMGAGHEAASRLVAMDHQDDTGGDVLVETGLSTAQARASRGQYTFVEDVAGLWLIETKRLRDLEGRRALILGTKTPAFP